MPFARPTLSELVTRIRADFRGRLGIEGSLLRRSMADVLAIVWAGAIYLLYGFLAWVAKQLFADTAEGEYLLRKAGFYGIAQSAAEFATGTVLATGEDEAVIEEGEVLTRDDGLRYSVTEEVIFDGEEAEVPVQALTAGATGNLAAGETLAWEGSIDDVDTTVTVDEDGLTGGVDQDSIEQVRSELKLRMSEPPENGAEQDWILWAKRVAGVTRAWVHPHEDGLGTLTVRFVLDQEDGTVTFPDAPTVAAVQAIFIAERPVLSEPTAAAPDPLEVDFTIAVVPDTTAVRDAVKAEIADLLRREGRSGDGAGAGTILLSAIRTAIGTAPGLTDYTLTVPSANVVPALGELTIPGTYTWT